MNEGTTKPRQADALTLRVVDVERRLRQVERTLSAINRTTAMLVDAEVERLVEDFTPEQMTQFRAEYEADVRRIAERIRSGL